MILRKPYRPMPRDLRSIEGFVPTGNTRASITIDPGSTYHQLELVTNITDAALIEAKTSQGVQSSELVTMAGDNITLWIDVGDLSGVDKPFIRGRAKIR